MGKKTDKKVKSDRINVLRKQYDAFLEEDKKRKDRNEYILGKLDKMRYNSAAVQLRHTPNTYGDFFSPSINRHAYRPENVERNDMQMVHVNHQITRPGFRSLQLDVPRNYVEETTILQEISQKYILIPKLRHTFSNDSLGAPEVITPTIPTQVPVVNPDKDIDNSDWKSKYDILEQLKKKESEEQITKYGDDLNNKDQTRNTNLDRVHESGNNHVLQNYKRKDLPTRFEEEIPEKDTSDHIGIENELSSLEKCRITEKEERLPEADAGHGSIGLSLNPENALSYDQTQKKVYDQLEQYDTLAEQNVVAVSHGDNYVDYQENCSQQEQNYPIEYDQFIPKPEADSSHAEYENANHEENEYLPIEVINPNELVNVIQSETTVQGTIEAQHEYPAEIIPVEAGDQQFITDEAVDQQFTPDEAVVQQFTPDEAVVQQFTPAETSAQQLTPDEAVAFQDPQGINPETYMTNDGTIGPVTPQMFTEDSTTKGIEEFDAENREMFYSEGANYAYEQGQGQEYNAEYAQNQNYPPTQDYAYYEGAEQAEGTYPVEINEHEETEQPYDQHYEQQYATNYEPGYEQQNVYMEQDPTQPQYEQPALYDQAHQEFEQLSYNREPAETQEQVEQTLDREDGYLEKQNSEDTQSKEQHEQN